MPKRPVPPLRELPNVGARFVLLRTEDVHGNSGVGEVASGWQMPSGRVIMEWNSEVRSFSWFQNVAELLKIHGHAGRTFIRWVDHQPWEGSHADS